MRWGFADEKQTLNDRKNKQWVTRVTGVNQQSPSPPLLFQVSKTNSKQSSLSFACAHISQTSDLGSLLLPSHIVQIFISQQNLTFNIYKTRFLSTLLTTFDTIQTQPCCNCFRTNVSSWQLWATLWPKRDASRMPSQHMHGCRSLHHGHTNAGLISNSFSL